MKGSNLGEFEELALLTIATLISVAYSVGICNEPERQNGRSVKPGVVHALLKRPKEKGFVKSKLGEATQTRGGKRKRYYSITSAVKSGLIKSKEVRDNLWNMIPNPSLNKI